MTFKQLILITGVERSGSTLISRVLQLCGANAGHTNKMRENASLRVLSSIVSQNLSEACFMPTYEAMGKIDNWEKQVNQYLNQQYIPASMPFMYKDSKIMHLWKLWNEVYPNAKWIIVRRRTKDILNSLQETAHMTRFKNEKNIKLVGVTNESDAWLWWINQYEQRFDDLIKAGVDYRIVWPERMRDGDFDQIKEVIDWCDLKWNPEVIDLMKILLR